MVVIQNLALPLVNGLRHRSWKQINIFIKKCVDMVENGDSLGFK